MTKKVFLFFLTEQLHNRVVDDVVNGHIPSEFPDDVGIDWIGFDHSVDFVEGDSQGFDGVELRQDFSLPGLPKT
jgi:hypothetical protein